MKSKKTKFFEGFLAGFIVGLFVYFVYYLSYQGGVFSIIWAAIFSFVPAIVLGLLLTLDKGGSIDTSRVSPLLLNPDFDKGESFKFTKTRWPLKYFAIGSFVLGLVSLLGFSIVFSPLAFVLGLFALAKGRKEELETKFKILAILGVFFSLISIVAIIYIFYQEG